MKSFLSLLVVPVGLGCAVPVETEAEPMGTLGKADEGTLELDEPPPELAGAYGVTLVSDVTSRSRETGERTSFTTRVDGWVRTEPVEGGTTLHVQPCSAVLPRIGDRQPTIPRSFIRTLSPIAIGLTLEPIERQPVEGAEPEPDAPVEDAEPEPRAPIEDVDPDAQPEPAPVPIRWRVTTTMGALLLGVRLDDPIDDPLPEWGSSRGAYDQDHDGRPGVTVHVDGHRVYVGARAIFRLAGELNESGALSGEAHMSTDLKVYGDDIWFYDARSAAEQAEARTSIVASEHRFVMTPLGAIPESCSDVE